MPSWQMGCVVLNLIPRILIALSGLFLLPALQAFGQQAIMTEEDMGNVFISGGYGSLFGACMGAATLPFTDGNATQNLRVVAGGASIGFIVGSLYGIYAIANTTRTSYFNYTDPEKDDDNGNNYYYSMPETPQTHGKNNLVPQEDEEQNDAQRPMIGALLMGNGKNIGMGIPNVWVGNKAVAIQLAQFTF